MVAHLLERAVRQKKSLHLTEITYAENATDRKNTPLPHKSSRQKAPRLSRRATAIRNLAEPEAHVVRFDGGKQCTSP